MGLELGHFFLVHGSCLSWETVNTALCVEGRKSGWLFPFQSTSSEILCILSLIHRYLFTYVYKEETGCDQEFLRCVLGLVEGMHIPIVFLCFWEKTSA